MRTMKRIIETFEKSLLKDIGHEADQERICLDKDAFDRMIDMLSDRYDEYKEQTLQEGGNCYSFQDWLKIQNSWAMAAKGSLNKSK